MFYGGPSPRPASRRAVAAAAPPLVAIRILRGLKVSAPGRSPAVLVSPRMAESAPTPPAEPPKPVFVSCDEVSVTVKCWEDSSTNPDPAVSYRIEYKEYPEVLLSPAAAWRARPFTNHTRYPFARQDWNDAKSIDVVPKPGAPIDVTCIDLKPCDETPRARSPPSHAPLTRRHRLYIAPGCSLLSRRARSQAHDVQHPAGRDRQERGRQERPAHDARTRRDHRHGGDGLHAETEAALYHQLRPPSGGGSDTPPSNVAISGR